LGILDRFLGCVLCVLGCILRVLGYTRSSSSSPRRACGYPFSSYRRAFSRNSQGHRTLRGDQCKLSSTASRYRQGIGLPCQSKCRTCNTTNLNYLSLAYFYLSFQCKKFALQSSKSSQCSGNLTS
jgi:hypothetical protein